MKETERLLDKAFALARRHHEPISCELPLGMETAVLAEWRSSRAKIDIGVVPVFRWAAILACVLALCSAVWKRDVIGRLTDRSYPEVTIINSAFTEID